MKPSKNHQSGLVRSHQRDQWIILIALLLLVCIFICWELWTEYQETGNRERERLFTQARVIDDGLTRQLLSTNLAIVSVIKDLPYLLKQKDSAELISRRLESLSDAMPGVRTLLLINAKGMVFASSRKELVGRDFPMQSHFQPTKASEDSDRLFVSEPFVGMLGDYSFSLEKAIRNQDGDVVGVISANIDPDFSNHLLESVRYSPQMWTAFIHGKGGVIDFSPKREDLQNINLATPDSLFTRHLQSGYSVTFYRDFPKIYEKSSLTAVRTIFPRELNMDAPLVIEVGRELDDVFAAWHKFTLLRIGFFVLASIFSALLLLQYQRRQIMSKQFQLKQDELSKESEAEIRYLAFYDPLTQLPNRRMLMDRLKQVLANTSRHGRLGALLFIDLDHFKTLNETWGHFVGDQLLQQVAQRLSTCVREDDIVARLGGDDFVVLLENLSSTETQAALQAESVGEKILTALGQPYFLGNQAHKSTPSVGITLFDARTENVDELLKRADMAMYQAKAAGRNTLCFFDPAVQQAATRRMELEDRLARAVAEQEFVLYYQPQVMQNGWVCGVEVLLRWHDPDHGAISPSDFIPLAEGTGLILPLGHWVIRSACQQLALWARSRTTCALSVAVNVSAKQLGQANFVTQLLGILEETGANPNLLKLEITESMLVHNIEEVIAKMLAIKALGVGFSIDDFGTGYSSLTYLKRLPLDQLKIDQSFVRDILDDPNDAAIANMVMSLASSMKLNVIAEGVETTGQRDFLASQGCNIYQGYLFCKPVPLAAFEAWLEGMPQLSEQLF